MLERVYRSLRIGCLITGLHFTLALSVVHAQTIPHHIQKFTASDGLAASEIQSLFQSSDHYLWIGHAAGISRFDGYQFENYLYASEERMGRVYAIAEDPAGAILAGSEEGLFRFSEGVWKAIPIPESFKPVMGITGDRSGGFWLSTNAGPVHMERFRSGVSNETINKESLVIPEWWKNYFPNGHPAKFINTTSDNAFFVTDGFKLFQKDGNHLQLLFETQDDRDYITGLVAIDRQTVYLSSQSNRFQKIKNGKWTRFEFSDGIGIYLAEFRHKIWYYAAEGIYQVDPTDNSVQKVFELPDPSGSWGSCLLPDTEGNTWLGTHEGLFISRPVIFELISQDNASGFDEFYYVGFDDAGNSWLGGNRGKVFRKPKDNGATFKSWQTVFPLAEVFDICHLPNGEKWFCSGYQGLTRWKNGRLYRYTVQDGLRNNSNYCFIQTRDGKFFVGGDKGVTQIVSELGDGVRFKNYFVNESDPSIWVITSALESPAGHLFFGSDHGLLEWKDEKLNRIPIEGMDKKNPSITGLISDHLGRVWMSTIGDGILLCTYTDKGDLRLTKDFTRQDGLSSEIYLSTVEDEDGAIWTAGYKDLTRIVYSEKDQYFLQTFGPEQGFSLESYHSLRMKRDPGGKIWMASSGGLICFDPSLVKTGGFRPIPVVQLTRVKRISKQQQEYPDLVYKTRVIPVLPYRFGSVTFQFTGILFSNPSGLRFAYRLLGSDSSWINLGSERSITFQDLPPASYQFEVRATGGNGKWSSPVSYFFEVRPPFWQRWWFYASLLFVSTFFLVGITRNREERIRRKEAEKTEMEKLKAISLQYQLEIEQVVNYFAGLISQQQNIDDMLWDVTRNCISKLGFEDCVIYLIDIQRKCLVQKAAWGPKTLRENRILNPLEIPLGMGIVGSVALTGKPERVPDTRLDKRYIVDDQPRLSELCVPILSDHEVLGVIDSEHSQENFYTERHLQILVTIATLCADRINIMRAEAQTREKEMELMRLNHDLVTSQLTALRSQMNPHFIFNSLNSIAQLVASLQNEQGLEYLNKFAKLLRLILDTSELNFISIHDEIRMLDLYLQLESLRFGNSFFYTIKMDESLDNEETLIPSFIIHPVVENAIWHGLLHKEGERRLIIDFKMKADNQVSVMVKDNGIGLEEARARRMGRPESERNASKGLKMVKERLKLLGDQFNIPVFLDMEDTSENGMISGTKVTIVLPAMIES